MITYSYIIDADENFIKLKMPDPKMCAASNLFKSDPHEFKIKNSLGVVPEKGKIAKIDLNTKNSIFLSLMLFIFPLIVFALTFTIFNLFLKESLATIVALISILIAFVIDFFIFKIKKFDVTIIEILKEDEIEICKNCDHCKK